MKHFLECYEEIAQQQWTQVALSNVNGKNFTHHEVVEEIAKWHLFFKVTGVNAGDHIGLAAANCAEWAIAFLAVNTYGGVAVPILANFTPENITTLCHHAECKILFTDKKIYEKGIKPASMLHLTSVVDIRTKEIMFSRNADASAFLKDIDNIFALRFPEGVSSNYLHAEKRNGDALAVINYTSGTTGTPKGIMLSANAISANINYGHANIPVNSDDNALCILPLAHMFGLTFEFLYTFLGGAHVYFLDKQPTPTTLMRALKEVQPFILLMVPLVLEKMINGKVVPKLRQPGISILKNIPLLNKILYKKIRQEMMIAFGGKVRHIILGGAALDEKVEKQMCRIGLPFTVGYGMTECGPLIGYVPWKTFKPKSCGKVIDTLEIRVATPDAKRKVGELELRGINVMKGYYKNPEATAEIFTTDGWMRTGDLGYIDKEGNIFIKGRSKCMILTANGQNIYPEELESRLNRMNEVAESLVIARDTQIVGLVVLNDDIVDDKDGAVNEQGKESNEALAMSLLQRINHQLPKFCQLTRIEICKEAFVHTPKGSIKRNLYH